MALLEATVDYDGHIIKTQIESGGDAFKIQSAPAYLCFLQLVRAFRGLTFKLPVHLIIYPWALTFCLLLLWAFTNPILWLPIPMAMAWLPQSQLM